MSFEDELHEFEDLDQCYLSYGWPVADWRVRMARKTVAGVWMFRSADAGGSFLGTQLVVVGDGVYNASETPRQGNTLSWWWMVGNVAQVWATLQSRYPQEALG